MCTIKIFNKEFKLLKTWDNIDTSRWLQSDGQYRFDYKGKHITVSGLGDFVVQLITKKGERR